MGHIDPLKRPRASTWGRQKEEKWEPKASRINKMQPIRHIQHLCGVHCKAGLLNNNKERILDLDSLSKV